MHSWRPRMSLPGHAVLPGPPPVQPTVQRSARLMVRLAWGCIALLPVSFVAAMVLGDWLLTVQGRQPGDEAVVPFGIAVRAGLPALMVLVAPAVLAMVLGLRAARRHGLRAGLLPAQVGLIVTIAAVVLNLVSYVVGLWLS
jgi:hypothetical protein